MSDDWLTPPGLIVRLGPFDLDPCASREQPWRTAARQIAPPEDGLSVGWSGFVWCNPPYGPATWAWLSRLADHGEGVALIFARTETRGFFRVVWRQASALLFLCSRLHFHHAVTGKPAQHNAGAPSCLVAYGNEAVRRLRENADLGALVQGWRLG